MNCYSLSESNQFIQTLLFENKPFLITRCGIGAETYITYTFLTTHTLNTNYIPALENNAGIYNTTSDNITTFIKLYSSAIANSAALATFQSSIMKEQSFFCRQYKLPALHSRVLEPFYCCLENVLPWSHQLFGKKVLIISPFIDSMKKQLEKKFQIFKDKKVFIDNQQFVFYKSYNTAAGNHIHANWFETYIIMCNEIRNIDFDIALLGCGGYGLPLCNFIFTDLHKSAIYIGGGLQLLFGIMGKRWENNEMWKKIIKENDTQFIRPSGDEILSNNTKIEGGCYW